jgi:hypothetical protein
MIVVLVFGVASFASSIAHANLVTNGGFENYTGTPPKDFTSNSLPVDWSTGGYVYLDAPGTADTAPGIAVYGPFPATSPALGNFIEADGSSGLNYPINQTINGLTVGQNYSVSFYQAAGQEQGALGATTEQWQVSLGSQTQFSPLMSIPQGGIWPWTPQSLTFTASSSSEVLSFLAIGSGGVPPIVFLDGVDMETTVPEPSAAIVLLGAGAGATLLRRRRNVRADATPSSTASRSVKPAILALLCLGFGVVTCGSARANLVTNGGFEVTAGTPKNFFSIVQPTDWATTAYAFIDAPGTADDLSAPGVPVYGPFPYDSPQHGNFLQSDGDPFLAAPITQTISTLTVGQTYNLSFYQAAGQQVNDLGATTEQWQVSLGSQTQMSALMSIPTGGVWPWTPQSMTFTATSSSEVLSFLAVGAGGVPPMVFLDGVDMESTVPEPSAAALLAVALVGAGMIRSRRRARATQRRF